MDFVISRATLLIIPRLGIKCLKNEEHIKKNKNGQFCINGDFVLNRLFEFR